MSSGGIGIHWDSLDEDISVEGLLLGIGDCTTRQHLAVAEDPAEYGKK